MGCDIHTWVEIKKDGKWEVYDWESEFYKRDDNGNVLYYEDECEDEEKSLEKTPMTNYDGDKKIWDHPLYIGRNYDLFAILASVRNGYGFAGIPTGRGFNPISMPKGLPDDVSDKVKRISTDWGVDGHSHSYHTLKDLLDYDWYGQSTSHYGVVSAREYITFKETGKPSSWCGGVSGRDIKHVDNNEMDQLISSGADTSNTYTRVEWEEPYAESIGRFLKKTIPALKELGDPENVRIVFFFDN